MGIYSAVGGNWPQLEVDWIWNSVTAEQASIYYKLVKHCLLVQYKNYFAQGDGLDHTPLPRIASADGALTELWEWDQ